MSHHDPDWVVLNNEPTPPVIECLRCQQQRPWLLSERSSLTDALAYWRAFVDAHRGCRVAPRTQMEVSTL